MDLLLILQLGKKKDWKLRSGPGDGSLPQVALALLLAHL